MPRTYPPAITGSAADPEFRKQRGRLGAAKTNSVDSLIRRLVQRAPELNDTQRSQLRALLASADGGAGRDG